MVLDIDQFRPEKGGNIEKVKENQRLRFCNVENVDKIVEYDNLWRQAKYGLMQVISVLCYCFTLLGLRLITGTS